MKLKIFRRDIKKDFGRSYTFFLSEFCSKCSAAETYGNNTDDNKQSEPGIGKRLIKNSEEIIGLRPFISGNSCDFTICRVFILCFFFDVEK